MLYDAISLNGDWAMGYSEEKYVSSNVPECIYSQVKNCVPGYWEDMCDKFQLTHFFRLLKINPDYGIQRYPIADTAPNMALPNIRGNFFYKRTIIIDNVKEDAYLYFSGVQNAVSVWINDIYLDRHEGYSTEFEISIPNKVLKTGENTIILSVSNHCLEGYAGEPISGLTSRAANECTGGITGDLELRFYKSDLRDVALFTAMDCSYVDVKIDSVKQVDFKWEIYDENILLQSGNSNDDFSFKTNGMELWSPENPKLYTLKLTCQKGSLLRKFGVRRFLPDGVHFSLNGIPYFLRGICEHCYFPDTIHPNHDKLYYRSIIKKIKELGFNFIRFHTYVAEEEYLEAADELGILVHIESPDNTTLEEWTRIVKCCRRHPCVVIYCCGNELLIDEPFIEHLHKCADIVHRDSDSLFSPLSALRGVEYWWGEPPTEEEKSIIDTPFKHNTNRFSAISEFSDMYSSFANGRFSYDSHTADPVENDKWSSVYNKPRVSHEICIDGTYTDLSLKYRYEGKRVGSTQMFTSLEEHLKDKGVFEKSSLYFNNSCEWQRRIRKYCFEQLRRSDNMAGYDFLGPIDTHWHTFGYDVGMMNEFYELKPGETIRNVLMYNSETILMTDLDKNFNIKSGSTLSFGVYVSYYGKTVLEDACLTIRILRKGKLFKKTTVQISQIQNGKVSKLYEYAVTMPNVIEPEELSLYITLDGDEVYAENQWELYLFPEPQIPTLSENIIVAYDMEEDELLQNLANGKDIVLFSTKLFDTLSTSFKIALAGRTSGNVATVIADHPLGNAIPNNGFCGWQFAKMLEGGSAVKFNDDDIPFHPIIEVVSPHKFVVKQAALFEFRVLAGRLIVCGFNFDESDSGGQWFKSKIIEYANSDLFNPQDYIDELEFFRLMSKADVVAAKNTNFAFDMNNKAAQRRKKG